MENNFKQLCLTYVSEYIKNKLTVVQEELKGLQQSLESEQKSSSGDKHETAKAQLHLAQEKLSKQLEELQQQWQIIQKLSANLMNEKAMLGACVDCGNLVFYLSTAAGKAEIAGRMVYFISSASPLAKSCLGKKAGETFVVNGQRYQITAVF
jgi:transcription elongation GreA/GreB family factor